MQPRHQVSAAAIELIKSFEGFRRSAAQLPDGRWTVGFGHTRSAREGARIGEEDASALLLFDLAEVCVVLNDVVFTPLTQNQFDALVSFVMNIGVDNFRTSSVLRKINEGSLLQAAAALEMWRKADFEGERIVVDALVRRRAAEKSLFLTPTDGFVPTPSPVVRPKVDLAAEAGLSGAAVELTAPLEGANAAARRETSDLPSQTPSSTETAAALVSARLQAILSDLDLAETSAPASFPQAEPAQAARVGDGAASASTTFDPALGARRRVAEARYEPMPAASSPEADYPEEWANRPVPEPISEGDGDLFDRDRYDASDASAGEGVDSHQFVRARTSLLPLALTLVVGLSLLAGATFWFMAAHPQLGWVAPSAFGWVLGLAGIGLLASSIYFLLERIGARDEDD